MRKSRRAAGCVLAAVVVASLVGAGPATADPGGSGGGPTNGRAGAEPRTVTLITGDRVTVVKGNGVMVERGKGRADLRFVTRRVDGHLHVIPVDALSLLRARRLDSRLFDVTQLLAFGYDKRADLPLIVTRPDSAGAAGLQASVSISGARVVRDLPAVSGVAVRAPRTELAGFWAGLTTSGASALRSGVQRVWLDGLRQPSLDVSVPQIGAPIAWAAGYDGTGMKVAVLDTGIDVTHPDLAGKVAASENFTEGTEDDRDLVGHGTHVASTVAGSGAASGGLYNGVAPGATLLNGKACVESGCAESWLLAGMQWAAEQGADVVNMSLGGQDTPEIDPIEQAVNDLTASHGTLFVIAAGNSGADATVSSPASADAALAVGAVDDADELASLSSRGPRVGDGAVKPDLTAPGVDIIAANSKDGFLGTPGEPYTTLSGTSMATPHAAGAAAILAQQHPDWSPGRLKAALMASAKPNPSIGVFGQGAGRVDVARAITQTATTSPVSVSFGRQIWPHDDDVPVTKTVTYANHGTGDVTLNLALTVTGPAGEPAPAGMFSLGATSVTVPAGGTADTQVTADTRLGDVDGFFGGRLVATATSGGLVIQTPLGVEREAESYNLTLAHTDRSGAPASTYSSLVIDLGTRQAFEVTDPDGTGTLRLPRGEYLLWTIFTEDNSAITQLVYPRLNLTADQAVDLDARTGRPIRVTVPDPTATPLLLSITTEVAAESGFPSVSLVADRLEGVFSGQSGPDQAYEGVRSTVGVTFAQVDAEGDPTDSPFVYSLRYFVAGRAIQGFDRNVARRELATVRADHAQHITAANGLKSTIGMPTDQQDFGGFGIALPFRLPFQRTEYYNTDNLIWIPYFEERVEGDPFLETLTVTADDAQAYRAGSTVREQWNLGPFGPSLAAPPVPDAWASRRGDTINAFPPIQADRSGRSVFSINLIGRTTLFRNGQKIAEVDDAGGLFEVPPGHANYRLVIEASRAAPFELSTTTTVAWTFRSGHVAGDEPVRLPLSVVKFRPDLDQRNTAPAGKHVTVPLVVEQHPGSSAAPVRSLAVDVSYDGGRTWRRVEVRWVHGQPVITLRHPDTAGTVSLRAMATDRDGNTVVQTIIGAYRIAPKH